ncbi:hypothetical protein J5N97_024233 [Dioscorea zingiberensis]|uniref:aspartate--tRNA ligase n=1 Tax=Dioscorea zingiberensis TaxID=325984 RepID=A0A9D5C613_9LILI|nr:hypothetical protein J5N97_024233 [Dioscorea zingiberensis]
MAYLVVRKSMSTVQCVLTVGKDFGSPEMVKFATRLSRESIIHVEGVVSIPKDPIEGATQRVEIQVRKLYCVNRAVPNLPFNLEDAARSEREFEKAEAIFRQFLVREKFLMIHSPKLIAGSREGGSAIFNLDYMGQHPCLAQSQLYKQMAICGGLERVFEIDTFFRVEDSYTQRRLSEFVGLYVEMAIKEHYNEQSIKAAVTDTASQIESLELDPRAGDYGDIPLEELQLKAVSGREWTPITLLNSELADRTVLLKGHVKTIRPVSKKMAYLVVRKSMSTVQCVLTVGKDFGSPEMVKFATGLSKEASFLARRSVKFKRVFIAMASAPLTDNQQSINVAANDKGSESGGISHKQAKKEAMKSEKLRKKQEVAAVTDTASQIKSLELDPRAGDYGDIPLEELQLKAVSGRKRTKIWFLNSELAGSTVLLRGYAQTIRPVSKKMAFLVVRNSMSTVQCILTVGEDCGSPQMVKFATGLSRESIIDVEGVVSIPKDPIKGATQQVEIQVRKLYCVNRAVPNLPFNLEDAARSEREFEKAEATGEQLVRVGQDTRLNHRVLDLRTPANQATFRIQFYVQDMFRHFLRRENFIGVCSPKLTAGSSEGGSAVFKLDYMGQPACLAQSPQFYKQMVICGGLGRVFEVGPVFRAENSNTHRHLCEFVGLDAEMEIEEHYDEVMDVVDRLFVTMFDYLNENCKKELEAIDRQYPFEPLKYLRKTLRLTFKEGVEMLKEAGLEVDPFGDLNTESERKLGRLVFDKYGTEFYILHRYPLAVRPFYTMPCPDDPAYSNSFDVFIRGEEIISGAQRIHIPELLTSRAEACGIDVKTISTYIDSFRCGAPPHGGFGAGLERVVMLFCGLDNIRKTSLFPRDPHRLSP